MAFTITRNLMGKEGLRKVWINYLTHGGIEWVKELISYNEALYLITFIVVN